MLSSMMIDPNSLFEFPQDLSLDTEAIQRSWPETIEANTSDSFSHSALPDGFIRLARISRSGTINFKQFPLDPSICPYVAISYCWGSPDPPNIGCYINHVDGRRVPIRKAVKVIIDRILARQEECVIWIDGLCINQENVQEKNAQVARMSEVYSLAQKTLAWLGEPDEYTKLAFDTIESTWIYTNECREALPPWVRLRPPPVTQFLSSEQVHAVMRVLNRPFFRRVWIIQELVLSKSIIFWCGQYQTIWQKLSAVACQLPMWSAHFPGESFAIPRSEDRQFIFTLDHLSSDAVSSRIELDWGVGTPVGLEMIPLLRTFRRQTDESSGGGLYLPNHNIPTMLSFTNSYDSTNPRDKIFALLSLVKSTLPINYAQSTSEVYFNTTKELVQYNKRGIHLLGLAGCAAKQTSSFELPSWVPDYSTEYGITNWSFKDQYFRAGVVDRKLEPRRKPRVDDANKIINLDGIIVDRISKVCSPSAGSWNQALYEQLTYECLLFKSVGIGDVLLKSLFEFMWNGNSAYPTGERRWDVIREVATASRCKPGFQKSNYILGFDTWIKKMRLITNSSDPSIRGTDLDLNIFKEAIMDASIGLARWPFITERGYMGLGLDGIQVGDMVSVFESSLAPTVIRKDSDTNEKIYTLVCEAFVYGIMQGEALDPEKWEDISLR
jgi:heterokaryon incompatibility protein (HET)